MVFLPQHQALCRACDLIRNDCLRFFCRPPDESPDRVISEVTPAVIVKILAAKVVIAMISGLVVEFYMWGVMKKHEKEMDIHVVCEEEHCSCEDGILLSALKHTLKIFVYFDHFFPFECCDRNYRGRYTGRIFTVMPLAGEAVAALVGLIPNCAFGCDYRTLLLALSERCYDVWTVSQCRCRTSGIIRLNRD